MATKLRIFFYAENDTDKKVPLVQMTELADNRWRVESMTRGSETYAQQSFAFDRALELARRVAATEEVFGRLK